MLVSILRLFSLFVLSLVVIGCSQEDNIYNDDSKYSRLSINDSLRVSIINNNSIQFLDGDGISLIIDEEEGSALLNLSEVHHFDNLSEGWHHFKFYKDNDSLVSEFYYNKLISTPSVLVPNKVIKDGRRNNWRYYNRKYETYMQESYLLKDTYFGSYHMMTPPVTDTDGIPLFVKDNIEYYHPVNIAQYALSCWNNDKIMTLQDSLSFLKCADCLGEKLSPAGGGIYGFDFAMHGITYKAPWFSGMAQGQMLSVMARAYCMTSDSKYKKIGKKILAFMIADAGDSYPYAGCKVSLLQFANINPDLGRYKDYVIYDEYVSSECSYVLNGNLFGLVGLHDFYEATGDKQAYKAFEDGCLSIEAMLPYYDYYGSTSYDLVHLLNQNEEPALSNSYAHDYHIVILDALYQYTSNPTFSKYRDIFISYYLPPFRN